MNNLDRVRITAYFQGEIKHPVPSHYIGNMHLKLTGSNTTISIKLPDDPAHGKFIPLKFRVKKENDFTDVELEGLQLTADKANTFAMSVDILEPGPKIGPKILKPDGTIWQQETLRRSENPVQLNRPAQIEPGSHYRLEINFQAGERRPEARLVKIEVPRAAPKKISEESQLLETVYPYLSFYFQLIIAKSKAHTSNFNFKTDLDEDMAKRSIRYAINKLHSEQRAELEEMCMNNSSLGEKAVGHFLLALSRADLGQLLQDQLKSAVGNENYSTLLGLIYNDIYVGIIDMIHNDARKYI